MISRDVVNAILMEYQRIQEVSSRELESRKNEIYNVIPRIKQIDEEISQLSINIAKNIIINSPDSQKLLETFRKKAMDLKLERTSLLNKYHYPEDFLSIKYSCIDCKDTGFIDNKKCNCFKQKLIDYAYKESTISNLLLTQNFDTFNFEFYNEEIIPEMKTSPRKNITDIYDICINFAQKFDSISENLLFTGSSGLGKTFLSSCIAKYLLDNGYTVFYQTSSKIFEILEQYKFSKEKDSLTKKSIDFLFDTDLLIIDDLGTEFSNSYTNSELFNILNSRLLQNKKTIISTNLTLDELSQLYSERIASRIFGYYKVLVFFGEDIRKFSSINFA